MTGSNYPAGVSQRDITHLCQPGEDRTSAMICITCKREMVEQWTDLWYVDGRRISDGPLDAPRGEKCCSRRCLSQYIYDTAPEDVKSLMRSFAVVVNEWSEAVRLRRSDRSLNLDWALRHSYLTHLMPRLNLEVADDAMEDFAEELIGRDAAIGQSDPPQWYMDATSPAKLTVVRAADVQMVVEGYGI